MRRSRHATARSALASWYLWIGLAACVVVGGVVAVVVRSGSGKPPPQPPAPQTSQSPAAEPGPTYPRIRGAVSQLPEWLEASEAPFDLKALFAPIPPEQNAAPLYLEALLEFSTELVTCFPDDQLAALRERVFPRVREFGRVYPSWAAGTPFNPADLDRLVAEYDVGFEKLARAQQRPRCVFETGIGVSALLPHAQAARSVAQVARLRNARDLERGEVRRPIETLRTLLRLNRDLQVRGYSITFLVGAAVEVEAKGLVLDLLRCPACKREHAGLLLDVLQRHEAASPPHPVAEGQCMEYVVVRCLLHDVEHRTGDCAPEALEKLKTSSRLVDATPGALLAQLARGQDAPTAAPLARQIDARLALMTADDYRQEIQATDAYFRVAIDLGRRPYVEQLAAQDRLSALMQKGRFLSYLLSNSFYAENNGTVALARGQAARRGALCLAALRCWQLDNRSAPPSLEAVLAAAGIKDVPLDPFSGAPLKMTWIDGESVIYSVGKDGRDDKALLDWDDGKQPGDFLFRLSGKSR
jgi:hypothetical protein